MNADPPHVPGQSHSLDDSQCDFGRHMDERLSARRVSAE